MVLSENLMISFIEHEASPPTNYLSLCELGSFLEGLGLFILLSVSC